jgi:hypothetical protein
MRNIAIAGVVIAAGALVLTQSTAGQVQPRPGPGSGVVTVTGVVDVGKMPLLDVGQRGEWKVALASPDVRIVNSPSVTLAAPAFVRVGGRYQVMWPAGEREAIVIQALAGSWVRTASEPRQRWLNLAAALAIEELP